MYQNMTELVATANSRGLPLFEVIFEDEMELSGLSRGEVFDKLSGRYDVMERSAQGALENPLPTAGALIEGYASTHYRYAVGENTLCGEFLNLVMARALSCSEVNASMGRICAMPTAGSCGIVPAVILSLAQRFSCSRQKALEALMTSSGIGAVVMKNATVAGSEGGCQAECGVAAAMAAGAAVYLAGGTNDMIDSACSFTLMNVMGLICDPVAGQVQIPCAQRNASQAINALLCADLVLGGMVSPIPADEVFAAMYQVGKMLPMQLKETALGGIAATPSAQRIAQKIFGEGSNDA